MLEALFELFGDLLFQLFGSLFVELGLSSLAAPFRRDGHPWLVAIGYAMLGAAFGAVSLVFFPRHWTPEGWPRLANLVAAPLFCGLCMSAFGFWRRPIGHRLLRFDRFCYGVCFAGSLALMRFFATQ